MNREELFETLGGIDPVHIQAAEGKKKRRGRAGWLSAVAAVLVIAVLCGVLLRPDGSPLVTAAFAIAEADYPQQAPYPNRESYIPEGADWALESFIAASDAYSEAFSSWRGDMEAAALPDDFGGGLDDFFAAALPAFLAGAGDENAVCSPLNVYMVLAMLAEVADGESRAQILNLLGHETVEGLREQAGQVWHASYRNDGSPLTCIPANSLWLNGDISYVQQTMDTLASDYYASSYQGKMGSAEYNKAFQSWLNEQTGGLLEEEAKQLELTADTVLALASAVYFRGMWSSAFDPADTEPGVFYSAAGDITADFMYQAMGGSCYWGGGFTAVSCPYDVQNVGGVMWLILPDEGVSVDDLLRSGEVLEMVRYPTDWEQTRYTKINLSLPRFDVSSQMDLKEGLQTLGVIDVFDPDAADFSPMTTDAEGIFVSRVEHDARVVVDEEGCTAASFAATIMLGGTGESEDEVDFVLNRPFLFVLTWPDTLPLFAGVVNQP